MNINGNALHIPLADGSVHTCVTSPPYFGLRDYGVDGQIGLEQTPDAYVAQLVAVFREVWRVLRDDGTLWCNLGDSYAGSWGNYGGAKRGNGTQRAINNGSLVKDQAERNGSYLPPTAHVAGLKDKDLIGIPWRVAFALQADGWYLRSDIIWHKPNPMPESVTDRPTKAHEYMFLLSKSARYYYDAAAVKEEAQVWTGRAATFERSGPVSEHVIPGQNAAQHRKRDDKQRGHERTHEGFRDKWDGMSKAEQAANGRNKRSVWTVATKPYSGAHFATYPPELITPCILAGAPEGGIVLDPFSGSGTTVATARQLGRVGVGVELNRGYIDLAKARNAQATIWEQPA
jgi:DNA modification methylase